MHDASGAADLLVPWRVERILRDDGDFLIVDKPPGIVVHGGDERLADDLVGRLGRWLTAAGRASYLGVHQRLDQATSGLLFFTRAKELNVPVARAMEEHGIRRTYLAVVTLGDRRRLKPRGRLEHLLRHARGCTSVVERGGQRAVTDYEILEEQQGRALVKLVPLTGRTHQLRVQLAACGAPICGDALYGGEPAPRLLLHASELGGGPLGGRWTSPTPAAFPRWLETGSLVVPEDPGPLLRDAGLLRYALRGVTSAYRLVNGAPDLLPGMVVDVYGEVAVLSLYEQELLQRAGTLARHLAALGLGPVYLKSRVRADLRQQEASELAPDTPFLGDAPPGGRLVVEEQGARFEVTPGAGLSTGLFVDQRDNRTRVRSWAEARRVLNLFSYTCSFSVAAALGGAAEVVSVDLSGRALERGRANFELNGISSAEHRFYKEDAVKWLARAGRRGERFGLIVLDPPSFSTVGKGTFSVQRRYGEVAAAALRLLEPGGRLLAVTNHTRTSPAALRKILHEAARSAGRTLESLRDLPSGLDCPPAFGEPWPSKSAVAEVR